MMNIYQSDQFRRIFGTWPLRDRQLRDAMSTAIEIGYRAFDTAQMYENEGDVGDTLATAGLPRESYCVTTKVTPGNYDSKRFMASVEESLRTLKLDHVDVLLLHWPPVDGDIAPPLHLLEQALHNGMTRNIGVSNFTSRMIRKISSLIESPIVTNQVEFHPLLNQDILLKAASDTGIPLSAYCSVAKGKVIREPELADIGSGYGKSAAQVALRWILQKGVFPVTMSTNPDNIRTNFDILNFRLSTDEMRRIDRLTRTNYRVVTHEIVPTAPEWD